MQIINPEISKQSLRVGETLKENARESKQTLVWNEQIKIQAATNNNLGIGRSHNISFARVNLKCFKDPIWIPRIENRVPRIKEIGSLQVHTRYLIFSFKKTVFTDAENVLTPITDEQNRNYEIATKNEAVMQHKSGSGRRAEKVETLADVISGGPLNGLTLKGGWQLVIEKLDVWYDREVKTYNKVHRELPKKGPHESFHTKEDHVLNANLCVKFVNPFTVSSRASKESNLGYSIKLTT